ncbi:uncharacterized protein LOC111381396 [Olea europaea var. sylvestris]|uniref:uncharacterized protein LOC111381396 n=1 Tax=Olea europaea var. sylvestris TaxID=158386 RepID=UPI000C1CE2CF|nr:uncharacterized protein LOC111381396 [Olea europaea var. sylvestris]
MGRIFRNKEIMKLSLSLYAIQNTFEYVVVRSNKKDYLVKCSHDDCDWICGASRMARTDLFKIRHIVEGHRCFSNIVLGSHRQATKALVSHCIKYKYTSSHTLYTLNDIRNDILHTYGVSLNYVKVWRSREETLKLIRGDPADSFNNIPRFFAVLQHTNPGMVTDLEHDGHSRFKYYFMALGTSVRGWGQCSPVVVVDGTYLSGHYGGMLFTACTQDANNSIYILAFAIGDSENDASWTWLFENLRKAYGYREGLCFVSDRHNSIKNAIEKSLYGKSGKNITQTFNSAVRAYTLSEYEYTMQQLNAINGKIRGYLDGVGPAKWSRFHMPTNRYSTMTLNIVESVNAVTKSAKNYPIVARIIQAMFSAHCENLTFVIEGRTCMCRMLQPNEWIVPKDFENIVVLPPNQKRSDGRPTEKRFKSVVEDNITVKCGHCGESGHNHRTCSSLVGIGYSLKEPVTCVVTITVRTVTGGGLLHLLHNKRVWGVTGDPLAIDCA